MPWSDLGPAGGQELADLAAEVVPAGHPSRLRRLAVGRESLSVPLSAGTPWYPRRVVAWMYRRDQAANSDAGPAWITHRRET